MLLLFHEEGGNGSKWPVGREVSSLNTAPNTEMTEGWQPKSPVVISTFHCFSSLLFLFIYFQWKSILMNVFNHGTEKDV